MNADPEALKGPTTTKTFIKHQVLMRETSRWRQRPKEKKKGTIKSVNRNRGDLRIRSDGQTIGPICRYRYGREEKEKE